MNSRNGLWMSAAIAGILGAAGATTLLSSAPAYAAKSELGLCKGANSCSGKSACGALKGKNGCAGEGYSVLSKTACENKKLSWQPMPAKHKKHLQKKVNESSKESQKPDSPEVFGDFAEI